MTYSETINTMLRAKQHAFVLELQKENIDLFSLLMQYNNNSYVLGFNEEVIYKSTQHIMMLSL